jgi:hypothetical protein
MRPEIKRFNQRYGPVADAIASVDIEQDDREKVARSVANGLLGQQDFRLDLFLALATDPLVDCAGPVPGRGCPHGRRIRVVMHDRHAEDGRAASWQRRLPEVRCISCGP